MLFNAGLTLAAVIVLPAALDELACHEDPHPHCIRLRSVSSLTRFARRLAMHSPRSELRPRRQERVLDTLLFVNRSTLRTRVALAICLASIAFVIYLIVTDTKIHGFTPWG